MKILITGGCGFVGSNLCINIKQRYPNYNIIALDNLKRRGSELNISALKDLDISFIHGDIRNPEDLDNIKNLDYIIDASAEPSVMAGMDNNHKQLIDINLIGTLNLLNLAVKNESAFIFLSTSRVYPVKKLNSILLTESETRFKLMDDQDISGLSSEGISECFPIDGHRTFYGSSKLACEVMMQEYGHYLGLPIIINRCGVIAGPRQMGKVDQGVAVLWVARHYWKQKLNYIGYGGEGKQVRDMLHIEDLFELIDIQIHQTEKYSSNTFNVGGSNGSSTSLLEFSKHCEEVTGNNINVNSIPETRPGDVPWYISDNSKIALLSGWKPKRGIDIIVSDIFDWIHENEKELKTILIDS